MDSLLESLNPKQQDAVTHIEKPLLVFAGPGTGKTRVVVYKLAYLIKEKGFKPEEILALTFSDNAAQEMQERIEELLPDSTGFKISTFHSFCYELIREYSLELGINSQGTVITEEYQQSFLLDNLDNVDLKTFKIPTRPIDLAKSFQGAISRFKQENITIEELEKFLSKHEGDISEETGKLRDFAKAYRLYEDFKASKGLLDFGDMQYLAVYLLETRPEILDRLKNRIKYIIVDEFQDTDFSQLQLIFLLALEGNITVVGDDDQSIYRFRGAYLTNIAEFTDFFQKKGIEPERAVLSTNYRCTGNIQNVANILIENNPERQTKEIETSKDDGEPVTISLYQNDQEQAKGIYKKIKELNNNGVPWDNISILVRRRADARPIIETLAKFRIPYEVIGSREYFREPAVRAVAAYLKVLDDPIRNQPSLGLIMQRPIHGIMPGEIPKLARYAKDKEVSLWEALNDLDDFDGEIDHFLAFRQEIERLFNVHGEQGLLPVMRSILFGKDFFRIEINRQDMHNVRLLNRFLRLASGFLEIFPEAGLKEFLIHIHALTDLGLEDTGTEPSVGKVHLMTVHGSKGKEFSYVFIPCLNEKRFPSRYQRYKIEIPEDLTHGIPTEYSPEELHFQEERRLLYVALTRGEDKIHLSFCNRYGNNKKDTPKSMYLTEILSAGKGHELVEEIEDIEEQAEEIEDSVNGILKHRIYSGISRGEWQQAIDAMTALAVKQEVDIHHLKVPQEMHIHNYLKELEDLYRKPEQEHIEKGKYSPSKLKTYEDCPNKYYYQYVLEIPGEVKVFFELGTIVHEVMEKISMKLKEEGNVTEEHALNILNGLWKPSVYESKEKEKQDRAEAEKMIKDFLSHQAKKEGQIIDIEKWIDIDLDGRKIRGRIDRIDDMGKTVEVIDYKTSKTRTSKPKLKKDFQMVLYWLGTERVFEKPVSKVGHWYLRMDQEWMVEITKEEQEEVIQRAREVINSIESKEFSSTPGYQVCMFCDYGELCDDKGKG